MAACPACSTANPEGARFCNGCGMRFTPASPTPAEERRVVSALFCDLVGFTSLSESADPEDIDRMLTAYFAMARRVIESYGGVVEKFIGDAVLGVFGVPAVHEDDPERAVRAGLRITQEAADLRGLGGAPVRLRVGINTGEVLARLGVAPGSGERFLAGDTINTAARIQSSAPEMGVAVGSATYEATRSVFEYAELEPASLKGKAEPVRVYHARSSLARLGTDITRTHTTPFVGRQIDLGLLRGLFDKVLATAVPHLVTVVGEPGLGKSRIVAELFQHVDAQPDLVTWRQGRCLPYGEGITFWALGEIVKAHAGILESDDSVTVTAKLETVLPEGDERPWIRQRLLPLLGLEATSSAERDEQFTAWRRFLEYLAEQRPTVIVFEDLHWADPALLAFIEHVADRSRGVPLLMVGTARPEFLARSREYGKGSRNHTVISLAPLTPSETEQLISAMLDVSDVPHELRAPIVERSGGNPLYAEEFVRLLTDRDLLARDGLRWALRPGVEIPFPESVQALIAARLDELPAGHKSMLADASVIGKVFWAGGIAAMGDHEEDLVVETMQELARKEFVRPVRRSSMAGEQEYAFWHVLTRDVAYGQLPRAARGARHVAAAEWIESKVPDRPEDLADILAYHYTAALDLATASGQLERADELAAAALRFLTLAGDRALGLDTTTALHAFGRALAMAPSDHPERAQLLVKFGDASNHAGRYEAAAAALEEAVELARSRDEAATLAPAVRALLITYQHRNDPRAFSLDQAMVDAIERLPPGSELVKLLASRAVTMIFRGALADGLVLAERAMTVATEAGLPRQAEAIQARALARSGLGDPRGLDDYREAIALVAAAGDGHRTAAFFNNYAIDQRNFEGPLAALDTFDRGIAFAEARGLNGIALSLRTSALPAMLGAGRFEEVAAETTRLAAITAAAGDEFDLIEVRAVQTIVLSEQGRAAESKPFVDWLVAAARRTDRADLLVEGLSAAAIATAALSERSVAAALLGEVADALRSAGSREVAVYLPTLVRIGPVIRDVDVVARLVEGVAPGDPYVIHAKFASSAVVEEARGETSSAAERYREAATRWAAFGVITEEGYALLGEGRCLIASARVADARDRLLRARDIFGPRGMHPALAETEALLRAT